MSKSKVGAAAALPAALIAAVLSTAFLAWIVMLFIGLAHGHDHRVPAFGYWATFYGTFAARVALVAPKSSGGGS